MNKPDLELNDTMKITKNKSRKKIVKGITEAKWIRNCQICNAEIQYKNIKSYRHAVWGNGACRKCAKSPNRPKSTTIVRSCPNCKDVIYYRSKWAKLNADQADAWCSKCRNSGKNNPFYGKQHTDTDKLERRKRRITELGSSKAAFNKTACEYFDKLNERNGWAGLHAMNGGEQIISGYFVDYYEPNLNIVIEYDEPHHEKPSVKKKDLIRQRNIIKSTGCKFYRYSEKQQLLYEAV